MFILFQDDNPTRREVAWWAHIGGFVAGAALMSLVGAEEEPPRRRSESPHHDPSDEGQYDFW